MLLKKSILLNDKTIQIYGSKSISNRLLIINHLFNEIKITNHSTSQDTELLKKVLEENSEIVDIHHAGTAMRFLTSYFAIQPNKTVILTGSERMKQRPIKPLVTALTDLGADIEYLENEGYPPLKILGKKIEKSFVKIPANISSQFITSLLLVGAKLENGLKIELVGEITSRPYLELTLTILNEVGIKTHFNGNIIEVFPFDESTASIKSYEVESDWSSASYFYSLAAIGRKNINLKSFKTKALQGDAVLRDIYKDFFGIETITDDSENLISLKPIQDFKFPKEVSLNMNDCPDIAQTVCVTAVALEIPFHITGLSTLKVKETDRLEALKNELSKLGCETEISGDSIRSLSFSKPNENISIATYNDHRMAMSFAPFCLIKELNIENPEVVEKSYPEFWEDFSKVVVSE